MIIINTKSDYVNKNQEILFDLRCPYKVFQIKRKKMTFQNWIHRLIVIRRTILKYNNAYNYFRRVFDMDNSSY